MDLPRRRNRPAGRWSRNANKECLFCKQQSLYLVEAILFGMIEASALA
jgi:hypothetical protein